MARRLVSAGHTVHVITSWREVDNKPPVFYSIESGIHIHWISVPYSNHMGYGSRIAAFLKFAIGAARVACRLPADVVFATSTPLTVCIPGIVARRNHRVPMVFEVRDLWPEVPIAIGAIRNPIAIWMARFLERIAYRASSNIIALSPGMAAGVAASGFPRHRISIIPNAADLEFFDPDHPKGAAWFKSHPELGSSPLVVYTGTLGTINGVGYLAQVAASLLRIAPEVKLITVGGGREEAAIRERAIQSGTLGRNFFMYPSVPKQEIVSAVHAASICLSLVIDNKALWANSANKFFDALAAGRPIAINHGGWQADLLRAHDAGICLPPSDADSAARVLAEALRSPSRLMMMGRNARRLAVKHFARDSLFKQFECTLRAAVGHRQ